MRMLTALTIVIGSVGLANATNYSYFNTVTVSGLAFDPGTGNYDIPESMPFGVAFELGYSGNPTTLNGTYDVRDPRYLGIPEDPHETGTVDFVNGNIVAWNISTFSGIVPYIVTTTNGLDTVMVGVFSGSAPPSTWIVTSPLSAPIPATLPLLGVGLAGLGWLVRRRRG